MIVSLPQTTTALISRKLQELRDSGGVVALGRVLSLIIETDDENLESAVDIANKASRLHPSRILVIARSDNHSSGLDAEIRVGGDAGASEVVVLRASGGVLSNVESLISGLLLPDAPIVAWWPRSSSANPAKTEIGAIADRRITDSAAQIEPTKFLKALAANYQPGDGDMAWTRITLWRSQIAAALESHLERQIVGGQVIGSKESPSALLLQGWLESKLNVSVSLEDKWNEDVVLGIRGVRIAFGEGELQILRDGDVAELSQPGFPVSKVFLPARTDLDCLIEDMRFLGEDTEYAQILKREITNGD
ncbi:MAG: hypothetical protein RIR89_725 [Actinomycetota bacterium]|jgi:glucose-6-phosphate dehydrogenase assembly protein OpcA